MCVLMGGERERERSEEPNSLFVVIAKCMVLHAAPVWQPADLARSWCSSQLICLVAAWVPLSRSGCRFPVCKVQKRTTVKTLGKPSDRWNPLSGSCAIYLWGCTVRTFNSCTSRPVVCQCLVVKAPVDNVSKYSPSTSMTHVVCESKSRSILSLSLHLCP